LLKSLILLKFLKNKNLKTVLSEICIAVQLLDNSNLIPVALRNILIDECRCKQPLSCEVERQCWR